MPSAQMLKTYAKEALWLTCAITQALLQRVYDRVLRCLYASERLLGEIAPNELRMSARSQESV